MSEREDVRFLQGDALEMLKTLPSESVHCCITSPPYLGLRCYGVEGQIGLEGSVEEHMNRLVEVFREVRRCLHPTGTLMVNYGDAYAGNKVGNTNGGPSSGLRKDGRPEESRTRSNEQQAADMATMEFRKSLAAGYKTKDLMELPSELARALRQDGWWLRSRLPWVKRSAMPESCTDRPSTALEYVFVLAKSERYFWDCDAVRRTAEFGRRVWSKQQFKGGDLTCGHGKNGGSTTGGDPSAGRNLRNADFYWDSLDLAIEQARAELAHLEHVRERGGLLLSEEGEPLALDVNTEATREAHFATFPRKLVEPLIKAGTSERGCCAECGAPWCRSVEKESRPNWQGPQQQKHDGTYYRQNPGGGIGNDRREQTHLGWQPSCKCACDTTVPATVLDPFGGSGTVAVAATKLGRKAILIDLKSDYIDLQKKRNAQVSMLL